MGHLGHKGKKMEDRWLTVSEYADKYRLSPKQVRRYIKNGLIEAKQPAPGCGYRIHDKVPHETPVRTQTPEEIVTRHEREQAVLSHFEDLRGIARQMKTQLWLPPPWQWDIAHLEFVFYVDTEKVARGEGVTGYKLPSDLVSSEKSKGHFRHFVEGDVHWIVQEDGSIILKLPVEDEVAFGHLKAHTPQESPAWGLFARWKQLGGRYTKACSSFLGEIQGQVRSLLFWWTIYHDAFCFTETATLCQTCGTENPADSKFCRKCHLPLGWLRPIGEEFEEVGADPAVQILHIRGYGNIDSVEREKSPRIIEGYKHLKKQFQGHEKVITILRLKKEIDNVETTLKQELESLCQLMVFPGRCKGCPVL